MGHQTTVARMRRPEFIVLTAAAAGVLAWFFAVLPSALRDADQILNTAIILAILGVYLIFDFRPRIAASSDSARGSFLWAGAGAVLALSTLLLANETVRIFSLFASICCFARGAGGVLLDSSSRRLLNSLFVTFTLFGALLVSLPLLDMPLRIITGRWAAQIFEWMQNDTELGFISHEGVPMLLLIVNGRPFHVAAECNGFGLLGTSVLLTFAFIFYRKVPLFDALLLVITAVFIAVIGNLFRIYVIVSLAPMVGNHYDLMHEIVGTITFYAFLGLQAWLTIGFGKSPRPVRSGGLA